MSRFVYSMKVEFSISLGTHDTITSDLLDSRGDESELEEHTKGNGKRPTIRDIWLWKPKSLLLLRLWCIY